MAEWGIKHRAPAFPATALEGAMLRIRDGEGEGFADTLPWVVSRLHTSARVLGFTPQEQGEGVVSPHCTGEAIPLSVRLSPREGPHS